MCRMPTKSPVADLSAAGNQSVPTPGMSANFPMAIDPDMHRVLVVFRSPPTLMALSSQDGHVVAKTATCGDADDVFADTKRHRVYVSCGEGVVDVFAAEKAGYRRLARVPTVSGARTSLFVPEFDRLLVAVRARSERAGGDLGVPSGAVKMTATVAALAAAALVLFWCNSTQAYRPFDGTDAAVADTGEVEIELGPVEYLREGAERTLLAPDLRVNYGFAGIGKQRSKAI